MATILRKFNCTQQQLYAIARAAWAACLARLVDFAAFKAKYTAPFITDRVNDINTAEALPDDEQRLQAAQLLREQMKTKAADCRDKWQRLKLYIQEAYPDPETQEIQLSAAGKAHYEEASRDHWDAVKRLMIDGDAFITANSVALLANANMPAGFPLIFATVRNEFETLYNDFVNATLDTEIQTQAKLIANNKVYEDLISMLKDGQRIYKDDEAVRKLFTFDQLLNDIAGPGSQGFKGTVSVPATEVVITGPTNKTVPVIAGHYNAVGLAAGGPYTLTAGAAIVEDQFVETGVVKTVNIPLV